MAGLWLCLCLIGVAAGSVLPADKTNSPCTPGTVWIMPDNCNTCFCLENGTPDCTRMDCSSKNPAEKSASGDASKVYKPLPLPEQGEKSAYSEFSDVFKPVSLPEPEPIEERSGVNCSQGEEWQEECNSCFCIEDGKAACTKMGCSMDSRALAKEVMDHCEPGDTWSDNCNMCHCVGRSQVVCSYGTCPMSKTSERHRRQAGCNQGDVRQADCNTCRCLSNGQEACTRRFCMPPTSQQASRFSDSAGSSAGSSDCVRECPADCGSRRGADGCLVCECGLSPFFGVPPPPQQSTASTDGRWNIPDVLPDAMPYGSRQPWSHADDSQTQRHSVFGDEDRSLPHRHSTWGDTRDDASHDIPHGFSASRDSTGSGATRGWYDGSGADRSTSPQGYGSLDRHRFTSRGNVAGNGIRFVSRRRHGGDSADRFSTRREDVRSAGGSVPGRQSSWEAFSNWSSSRRTGNTADADGWTTVGRK